jgi:protein SCO1
MLRFLFLFIVTTFLISCKSSEKELPYLGIPTAENVKPTIPDYNFTDQQNQSVTPATFEGKIYVSDFFFTSCPTICPKVTAQMLRIYEHFKDEKQIAFLSHSIDTRHDSVPKLKAYADKLHIDHDKWRFVTGKKEDIFGISKNYMSIVLEDADAPGGYDHSGYVILVDKTRHIRAYCNGTDPADVDKFILKIETLLKSGQ